jgi:hypothetical protein
MLPSVRRHFDGTKERAIIRPTCFDFAPLTRNGYFKEDKRKTNFGRDVEKHARQKEQSEEGWQEAFDCADVLAGL